MTSPDVDLTPEEEDALDAFANEVATAYVDAMLIKMGLLDEPTTQMGRDAYAKVKKT